MAELPRGTVTLVFTDIEGSTRLLTSLGSRYEAVLADHRKLLRDVFSSHAGIEVDTQGDAFFYAFPRARDALHAAASAQRALADHDWPEQIEVRVRMGIHSGEPTVSSEGYVGADVHLAARVCASAHGGQVLLSDATAGLLPQNLEGIALRRLGEHRLKDIDAPTVLHQLTGEGLAHDFPPLRTPSSSHPTNLPPRLAPLIGRDANVVAVTDLVRSADVSVVTLVGPGGTGKTRLALAVGAEVLSSFTDGVFFVDLSALVEASLVVPAIAQALSLRETPGRSLGETLTEHLSSKEMLLILDNFEQVVEAAPNVSSLLTLAPGLKVLVTSREALRIGGENEFPVAPLDLPSPGSESIEILSSPAAQLFLARARAVRPGLSVGADEAIHLANICRRLDGLPLAIELAAARVKVLPLAALESRLEQSLAALGSGRRDASDRQRTLDGAIAWSYGLLDQDERRLFSRLGVFAGGWTLEAAEAVCNRGDLDLDVLDGLGSLVDKSLVREVGGDEGRLSMLETIRNYAIQTLEGSGEAHAIRRTHAEHFAAMSEKAEPHLVGEAQKEWLDRLERDHDNLRAALRWMLTGENGLAVSTAAHISRFWYVRGYLSEGRSWLELVLESSVAVPSGADVTVAAMLGVIGYVQGDLAAARSFALRGVSLAQELHDERGVLSCTETLALCDMEQGEYSQARRHFEENLEGFQSLQDERAVAVTVANLGVLAMFEGDRVAAFELNSESLRRFRAIGDKEGVAGALVALGANDLLASDPTAALPYLREGLDLAAYVRHPELVASALEGLAAAVVALGQPERGAVLMGGAERIRKESGVALDAIEKRIHDRASAQLANLFTESKFKELFEQGTVMSINDLVRSANE